MKKKTFLFTTTMVAALVGCFLFGTSVQAAKHFETGNYSKRYFYDDNGEEYAASFVNIEKVKKGRIWFTTGYVGLNGSPIYETNVIQKKINAGQVKFSWKDSWENSGTGILKPGDGCVKLKMKVTKQAKVNRATLDTDGEFITLKRRGNLKGSKNKANSPSVYKAYANWIANNTAGLDVGGYDHFQLIYVNDDETPELLALHKPKDTFDNNAIMQYGLYSFQKGKVKEISSFSSGVASAGGYRGNTYYIPEENRIYETYISSGRGEGEDIIYKLNKGKLKKLRSGSYSLADET
ncbi:MAG: hypothetical protein IJ679_07195, partial [Lachnospiraceae bacterium]|nr:hypothetical protein [Lachnospiraceae bacterium]